MVVNAAPSTPSKRLCGGLWSSVLHSVGVICGDYKLVSTAFWIRRQLAIVVMVLV